MRSSEANSDFLAVQVIIFVIYWLVVLIRALWPKGPIYEEEDTGYYIIEHIVVPGDFFSSLDKWCIIGVFSGVVAVNILFWDSVVMVASYIIWFWMILFGYSGMSIAIPCFGYLFLFILTWFLMIISYQILIVFPAKFIQRTGLFFSRGLRSKHPR